MTMTWPGTVTKPDTRSVMKDVSMNIQAGPMVGQWPHSVRRSAAVCVCAGAGDGRKLEPIRVMCLPKDVRGSSGSTT